MTKFIIRMHEDKVFFSRVMTCVMTALTLLAVVTVGAGFEYLMRGQ
ncbi:hypothetical protein [Cupriavidus sp. BIS7]|nr:hypothetical protein [Cupriavidus sp. BIS7]